MSTDKIQNLTAEIAILTFQKVNLDDKISPIIHKIEYHEERKIKAEERYLRCVNRDHYHGLMDPLACQMAIENVKEDVAKWEEVKKSLEDERDELVKEIQSMKDEVCREDTLLQGRRQEEFQDAMIELHNSRSSFNLRGSPVDQEALSELRQTRLRHSLRSQDDVEQAAYESHRARSNSGSTLRGSYSTLRSSPTLRGSHSGSPLRGSHRSRSSLRQEDFQEAMSELHEARSSSSSALHGFHSGSNLRGTRSRSALHGLHY